MTNWNPHLPAIVAAARQCQDLVDLTALARDLRRAEMSFSLRQTIKSYPSDRYRIDELTRLRRATNTVRRILAPDGAATPPFHIMTAFADQNRPNVPSEDEVRETIVALVNVAATVERWVQDATLHIEQPPVTDPKISSPPELPETWLVGAGLPAIYEKHFGSFPNFKVDNVPSGPGVAFVMECCRIMRVPVTPEKIDVYRRRRNVDTAE